MSYFKHFPILNYKMNSDVSGIKNAVNLMESVKFLDFFQEITPNFYVDYIVKDGERPEHIAERAYGRSDYHWIILLTNQIVNPFFDWPLSQYELESQILKLYPGSALFFDTNPGNINFTVNNTSTVLQTKDSQFVVGETISQTFGNSSVSGTILDWDTTLRKVVVSDITEGKIFDDRFVGVVSTNADGTEFSTPNPVANSVFQRFVLDHSEAVHHFEDDFGNILDPYANIDISVLEPDQKIYAYDNIFTTSAILTDYPLNRYIRKNGQFEANVVTNRQFENSENDLKRKIKVLKQEYVDLIAQQLPKAFKT